MSVEEPAPEPEKLRAIVLEASVAPRINVAFHQNSVPAISEIKLINDSDHDLRDIEVIVSATPPFLNASVFRIDHVQQGGEQRLNPVSVELDPKFLINLAEAVRAEVDIRVRAAGAEVAILKTPCEILSPSEWTGLAAAPELVAAFVRPNDPSVDALLRNAAEKLRQAGREPSLDGYRTRKKSRAWELAEAIWAALVDEQIVYSLPPQSFETNGQKVRSPGAILERKVGTCLDLTLLYAACLEQAGLNPLIGFSEGHAFCGIWLTEDEFSIGTVDEAQTLRKRMQLDELILVETTLLTNQPPVRFRAAVDRAASLVAEDAPKRFELVVDVRRTRHRQIRPLALGTESSTPIAGVTVAAGRAAELEIAPTFTEEQSIPQQAEESLDRLERWKRKLLDLSLRNKLLNFKPGRTTIELRCPDPGALEDKLAAGESIRVLPRADVMSGADPRNADLHFRHSGDDAVTRYAAEALVRGEVHANLDQAELEERLTETFRSARTSFEEGGANSLYLALGFVSWAPQGKQQICKAPLLLVPASLERRSVRSGFRLLRHDEDARINPTLLEMLRQDFKLSIPEFERELLSDSVGVDVQKIWQIARTYLKDVSGFEVTGEVVLSTFSFVKYLMWKDLVDRTDVLKRNPVVRHLIDTPKESYGDPGDLPDEYRLDDEVDPRDFFMPLPADSSQSAAVVAASRAKDFVLFGPPGTGKSQTIANMIVQLLAHGRTVLFVSQKTTALEVVRKRLNNVGLGSFCLEVHSAKAQKGTVLAQLNAAWETRSDAAAAAWDGTTADLKQLRDQLNAVVRALHRRHPNGLTAHQALGRVISGRGYLPEFVLSFGSPDQHGEAEMRELRNACRNLRMAVGAVGEASGHTLAGIRRKQWSPAWQNQLVAASRRFRESAISLARAAAQVTELLGSTPTGEPDFIFELLSLTAMAFKREASAVGALLGPAGAQLRADFDAWKAVKARYDTIAAGLPRNYSPSVFEVDLVALHQEWKDALGAMVVVRGTRKKRVWQALSSFTTPPQPNDVGAEIAALIEMRSAWRAARTHDQTLSAFGAAWRGLSTETAHIEQFFQWADETRSIIASLAERGQPKAFWIDALLRLTQRIRVEGDTSARTAASRLLEAYRSFETARAVLAGLAETVDGWLGIPLGPDWLMMAVKTAETWDSNSNQLSIWCRWNEIADEARVRGLEPIVRLLVDGSISGDRIDHTFELGYARWWGEQVIEREEALCRFVAPQHDDTILRFAEVDARVTNLARQVVAGMLSGNLPPRNAFGSDPEFGTLAREIGKRARQMPLRQLFGQMPTALSKLAPCMMMSPLSIAQYLPADANPFDVVIFDEASQIPVWDAVGAIARGRQVIVVGDPKQLPPTSFFDRSDDGYDDASDLEDLESILDECMAANIPHKQLSWHYRSRHESLIAFSNERYYKGQLVTFPSPVTNDRAVRYVHVPGGIYERGSGRVNREEARAIVKDVVQRLRDPLFAAESRSLGIVTFNTEQQRLIENLLDQERRSRPEMDRYFGRDWHEPVFVKNLESVQGDERDAILFSVGYGPDASGRVSQNFGPLNKEGGARRLNVAITRARTELIVYATLRPDQIELARTKAVGVRDFKHFLEYAERGPRALAEAAAPLDRDTDSPFEDAVKQALEDNGWVVHPQVGVAGFRIDLGIVHPDAPGRYLAGVECDGATYHRSATARDRDLLRERVLRNLGWRIHRVWSLDWWVNADRAMNSLQAALIAELESDRTLAAMPEAPAAPDIDLADLSAPPQASPGQGSCLQDAANSNEHEAAPLSEPCERYADLARPAEVELPSGPPSEPREGRYKVADLVAAGFKLDRELFYDMSYRPNLRRMIAHVISTEGPIFDDLMVTRIARAHGFGRAAGKIREIIMGLVERRFPRSTEDGRRVYWAEGADTERFPAFRTGSLDDRDHVDIPLVELASLAKRFVDGGAEPEEAAAMMGRELGLARLRETARKRFEEAARMARRDLDASP